MKSFLKRLASRFAKSSSSSCSSSFSKDGDVLPVPDPQNQEDVVGLRSSAAESEPQRGSSIQPRVGTPQSVVALAKTEVPTLGSNSEIEGQKVPPVSESSSTTTERGAHAPRVQCSAPPPNTSTPNSKLSSRSTGQNPQPSPLEDLNYNRNGKIARLSRALRDRINLALYNRCTAKDLARALNQMPEVKAVLAQYFNGRPLKRQNIDEWKHGGYRDWLHHRQLLEQQRELAADAKDLAGTAKGITDSLFGILTLNYTDLIMNRDQETPEEFEKKRKELSLVSQDISRMHRCHINTRRVEVQETRLDRDQEKTTEQLHFKFMEWVENPAIRRALILGPMEANRQTRQKFGMPPTSDDLLVEKLTRNDPYFNPPAKKQAKSKPKPAEKSHPESKPSPPSASDKSSSSSSSSSSRTDVPPVSDPQKTSQSPVLDYAGKTTSQIISEIEGQKVPDPGTSVSPVSDSLSSSPSNLVGTRSSASGVNPQNPTSPKPPRSPFEQALREGKTFLEALYAQSARPKPGSQPAAPASGSSAWDSFCEPVRQSPYVCSLHHEDSGFKLTFG